MNQTPRPVPVPQSWREASKSLRLAMASEELARASAASQDVHGTVRALLAASRAARRAAARLGQAAGIVDRTPGITGQKERTR